MTDVLVSISALTDVGMHRTGNEDSFLVADLTTGDTSLNDGAAGTHKVGERGSLLIVSDGMGGAAAGEIASDMAVKTIHELLKDQPLGADVSEYLRRATEKANERIWGLAQENSELTGMGATVTAVLVHGTIAYIAQVGDSRAYLLRSGQIKQLTKDQSLAQMLVDAGAIQPDQVASVPQNVIMQALGTQPTIRVAMTTVQLFRKDHLVLCSDGLSNKIDSQEMQEIIEDSDELAGASREMIDIANERGGEDNITVIIARFDGSALHGISGNSTDLISTHKRITLPDDPRLDSAEGKEEEAAEEEEETTLPMSQPVAQDGAAAASAAIPQAAAQQSAQADEPSPAYDQPPPTAQGKVAEDAEAWPYESQRRLRKRSYSQLLIIAVISLTLIAAAAYFFYLYLRQAPQPSQSQEPPAPAEQQQPAPAATQQEQSPQPAPASSPQ